MTRLQLALCIALGGAVWPLGTAVGQVSIITPVSAYYDWEYDLATVSDYQFETGIDGGGAFSVLRFEGSGRGGGPFSQNLRLFMDFAYVNAEYDFGFPIPVGCPDPAACFTGSPWNTTHRVDLSPGVSIVLTDRFHIQLMVPMRWHFESGSEASGFTGGFIGALRLQLADDFTAALGVAVQSEIEEGTSIYPVIGLDWRFSKALAIETRGGPYQGGTGALVWRPGEAVQMRLSVGYERRRFRLARDPTNPDGVGEYTSVPLLGGLLLNLGQNVDLSFEGGIATAGELEIENARGLPLRRESFDTAGLLRGRLAIEW